MSRSSTVTVVIPTRNRLPLLKQAIHSVEQQTFSDWQLVIVDDASEDDTWSWISAQDTDRVVGIRIEEHGERSEARNRGLVEAESPFILFLDDDDRLQPHALADLSAPLEGNGGAVAAVGGLTYFDDEGHRQDVPHLAREVTRTIWAEAVFGWVAHTGRTLLRTGSVRDAGGFPSDLVAGEDRDLWLRLSRLGPVVFVPRTVLDHRLHPGQWRPFDVPTRERLITRRHLATLPERDRRVGERILVAFDHYIDAHSAWQENRPRDAMRSMIRFGRAPWALVSTPLYRKRWLRLVAWGLVGSVFGARSTSSIRRLRARARAVGSEETWDVPFPRELPPDDRRHGRL